MVIVVVVLVSFVIALLLIWLFNNYKISKQLCKIEDLEKDHDIIELTQDEQTSVLLFASVSSVTFFEGNTEESTVKARLLDIVRANRWLLSRLVSTTSKDKGEKAVVLVCPKEGSVSSERVLNEHFEVITINNDLDTSERKLNEKQPVNHILSMFEKQLVKKGEDCLDRPDEVLFKVLLIKITEQDQVVRTALLVSMSHVLGDGHSFYLIHNMFDYEAKVTSYIPDRQSSFPHKIEEKVGTSFQAYFKSVPFIASVIFRSLFGRKKHLHVFKVDSEKIKAIKEDYQRMSHSNSLPSSAKFISTNDILTSWFLSALQVSHSTMLVNYRNRIPEVQNYHIGNYVLMMLLNHRLYQSPEMIRYTLEHYDQSMIKLPTLYETLQFQMASVTNWSTFYQEIRLTSSQPSIFHSPLITPDSVISMLIIFQPKPKELAVAIVCHDSYSEKYWLEKGDFLCPTL